jgi:hypothetical protein
MAHSNIWSFGPNKEFTDYNAAMAAFILEYTGGILTEDQFFLGTPDIEPFRNTVPINSFPVDTDGYKLFIKSEDPLNRVKFTGRVIIPSNTFIKYIEDQEPTGPVWKSTFVNQFLENELDVYEDDILLERKYYLEDVEVTPGSYIIYYDPEDSSFTLHLHASDSSQVRINGKRYEATTEAMIFGFFLTGAESLRNLHFQDLDIQDTVSTSIQLNMLTAIDRFDGVSITRCRFKTNNGAIQLTSVNGGYTVKYNSFVEDTNKLQINQCNKIEISDHNLLAVIQYNYSKLFAECMHVRVDSILSGMVNINDNIFINGWNALAIDADNISVNRNLFKIDNKNYLSNSTLYSYKVSADIDFIANACIGHGNYHVHINLNNTGILPLPPIIADMQLVGHNGQTNDFFKSGNLLYVAGYFTEVYDADGSHVRNGIGCLNLISGIWEPWNPVLDGQVQAIIGDGTWIYLAGTFTTVNGNARASLARVNPVTAVEDAWNPGTDGSGRKFYIDGGFLWLCGAFLNVGGQPHEFIAKFSLPSGTLDPWRAKHTETSLPHSYLIGQYANVVNSLIDNGTSWISLGGHGCRNFDAGNNFMAIGYVQIDKTTGEVSPSADYGNDQQIRGGVKLGNVIYCGGDFGYTTVIGLPSGPVIVPSLTPPHYTAVDVNSPISMSLNFDPDFGGVITGNEMQCMIASGANLLVGGWFRQLNGDTNKWALALIDINGNAVPGFNAVWSVQYPNLNVILDLGNGIAAIGGYFQNNTLNGIQAQGLAFIDKFTGARI